MIQNNATRGNNTLGQSNNQKIRTPVAWFQRDINLTQNDPRTRATNNIVQPILNQRPSSPSLTTTSSDDREEVPMVRHQFRRPNRQQYNQTVDRRSVISHISKVKAIGHQIFPPGENFIQPYPTLRSGTVRSSKSVPGYIMTPVPTTWDGEPCPVHGCGSQSHNCNQQTLPSRPIAIHPSSRNVQQMNLKKYNSLIDIRNNGNVQYPILTFLPQINSEQLRKFTPYHQSQVQSSQMLPISSIPLSQSHHNLYFHQQQQQRQFHPQQKRPPFIAPNGMQISEQFKLPPRPSATLSKKELKTLKSNLDTNDDHCCKGHLIVLWIILAVVTVGVISGVILGITV